MTSIVDFIPIISYVLTVFLLISNWSMLTKDNIFYQLAHHLYLGVAIATATLVAVETVTKVCLRPMISTPGESWLIIPFILGLLIFLNQTRTYSWVSRYPLMIALGVGVALGMRGTLEANILAQLAATIRLAGGRNPLEMMNNLLAIVIALTALYYFFFHFAHKTPGHGLISKIGRLGIMANFGVTLAGYMMFNATFVLYQMANLILIAPPPGQQVEAVAAAVITLAVIGILYWTVPRYIFPRLSEKTRKTL